MRRRIGCLLVCIALLAAGQASARVTDDVDTEIAKRHFRKGSELYLAGSYEEALAEFQAAQLARPLPAFSYNIARCFDRLERLEDAIRAYQAYLDAGPAAQDVDKVKARIDELRERAVALAKLRAAVPATTEKPPPVATPVPARTQAAPAEEQAQLVQLAPAASLESTPAPAARDQPEKPRRRVATWVLTALTLALAAGSIAPLVLANQRFDDAKRTCAPNCSNSTTDGIARLQDTGWALVGCAGAAAVGTIIAAVLETRGPGSAKRLAFAPAPGGLKLRF